MPGHAGPNLDDQSRSWIDKLVVPDGVLHLVGAGSRTWTDSSTVSRVLEHVRSRFPLLVVIEGGQRGADQCVARYAASMRQRGVHWIHVPAPWGDYPTEMRWKAGHDRNEQMAQRLVTARDAGHGVAVLAFKERLDERLFGLRPDHAKGGTEDMIRRSWGHGIGVWWCRGLGHYPERCVPAASLDV